MNKKNNFSVGDLIIYKGKNEILKGIILNLLENELEIEVGFCHKKSEGVYTDIMRVKYDEILPLFVC